jgi:hypothetical protein
MSPDTVMQSKLGCLNTACTPSKCPPFWRTPCLWQCVPFSVCCDLGALLSLWRRKSLFQTALTLQAEQASAA